MASSLQVGHTVPEFRLQGGQLADDGSFLRREYELGQTRGRPLVLAFYPGDETPVCTRQLCAYSEGLAEFQDLGADVWGISPQGLESHEAFARAHGLRMPLLADTDRAVARMFGIAVPGLGLRRSVFLVAADGTLHWKHVALLGTRFQPVDTLTARLDDLAAR
ncbi:peroxiredoxin [Streptomyces sp. MZ04]|uniref:peroxiredoxin n=1 Tax=Streptomyces sp. MZ04 TaxID=2559236 RepID=UPI00107EB706|nr:peroxiredoxin [Streptomyces sp. MZ04]TGB10008.1 peroxiredoxin [Streptomyces sp. MZ04]